MGRTVTLIHQACCSQRDRGSPGEGVGGQDRLDPGLDGWLWMGADYVPHDDGQNLAGGEPDCLGLGCYECDLEEPAAMDQQPDPASAVTRSH